MHRRFFFAAASAAVLVGYACSSPRVKGSGGDECETDDDCGSGEACDDGSCVDGSGPSSGPTAGAGGSVPGAPCATSLDCSDGLLCDHWKGVCVGCRVSADCAAGSWCKDHTCAPATACASDLDCSSAGQLCDTEAKHCVECNSAADCPAGVGCVGHSCVPVLPCGSSLDCADKHMICADAQPPAWPATTEGKTCQECGQQADCPTGSDCQSGLCYDICKAAGRICGEFNGVTCGECAEGTCTDTGTTCRVWSATLPDDGYVGAVLDDATAFVALEGKSSAAGAIFTINRATGKTSLRSQRQSRIKAFTGNSTELFWSEQGAVYRMAKAGGNPILQASLSDQCNALVATEDTLYCSLYHFSHVDDGLYEIDLADGSVAKMWVDEPPNIALGSDRVYWSITGMIGYTAFHTTGKKKLENADVADGPVATAGFLYWTAWNGQDYELYRRAHDASQSEAMGFGFIVGSTFKDNLYGFVQSGELVRRTDAGAEFVLLSGSDVLNGLYRPAADAKGVVAATTDGLELQIFEVREQL